MLKIPSQPDCRWALSARGADAQQEYEKNDKPYWGTDFDKFTLTLKSSNADLLFRTQEPYPARLDIVLVAKPIPIVEKRKVVEDVREGNA